MTGKIKMPYTKEDGGLLNNFATEPKMYKAEPASSNDKRNYLITTVIASVLVGGLIAVAFVVSNAS
jgi:predicted secreted protein